ncbi:MAG: type II toxin-antitoxin system RelE/ParE family toxin [Candidatus Peregrinibacteria bacterium]
MRRHGHDFYASLPSAGCIGGYPKSSHRRTRTFEHKLTTEPKVFSKPLRKGLKGYRRLHVDNYRIMFRTAGSRVIILIAHHSVIFNTLNIRKILRRRS